MPDRLTAPPGLGQDSPRGGTVLLQHRQPRARRVQPVTTQDPPRRDRGDPHAIARELIADPLRAARRPRQRLRDDLALDHHRHQAGPAPPGQPPFRVQSVGAIAFKAGP